MRQNRRTIRVDALARVEGEGGLSIRIRGDEVAEARFHIFEPPRFFEAFLRGRHFSEVPDITARICGICPIAYMMSASQAMESGLGVEIPASLEALRRLIYCGEWIESHALHVYLLHAPDFLGYADAIRMAKDHPREVERGLKLKQIGNDLISRIGGREVHPVNLKVGGFFRAPERQDLLSLKDPLLWARDAAYETVRWVASFPFPDHEADYEFVCLQHPEEYAILRGRLVSNKGLDIPISQFEEHFQEEQVPHSTALHALILERGPYHVGPLARFNINYDHLSPVAKEACREAGLTPPILNPFKSIAARAVEILYACDEAVRLISEYETPETSAVECRPANMTGCGCTEAPRGICWHRYRIDEQGAILDARIVPPTSQNQKIIEQDLKGFVQRHLHEEDDRLKWLCEQMVRNYDPCISCSCHALSICILRK
ncbi:MAG: Ni/Fe hydrogenase subunit alpha [Candidatus Desulfacyla sp.]